jgi:hypothetical protein
VKNAYDALVELGYDARAEELRTCRTVNSQKNKAKRFADEVEATIDLVTGEFEAPEPDPGLSE